jgi:exosortase/archaeosortase family protein
VYNKNTYRIVICTKWERDALEADGRGRDLFKPSLGTIMWILAAVIPLLTLIRTIDEILVKAFLGFGAYTWIERYVSPIVVRAVSSILKYLFGLDTMVGESSFYILTGSLPHKLCISWNCTGWQSFLLLAVCLVTLTQGKHTTWSKFKCALIGVEGTIIVNLLRIASTALILLRWGYSPAIMFHDYVSPVSTTAWLVIFWLVSDRFILEPSHTDGQSLASKLRGAMKDVKLRNLLPDFIFGRRTMAVTTMAMILTLTSLSGIGVLSTRIKASPTDYTNLTFEYEAVAVTVNGITTNRILTHPSQTSLGANQTDSHTAPDKAWHEVWNFYLSGPLEQPYTITGRIVFKVYMYASQAGKVNVRFHICDVNENGASTYVAHYDDEKNFDTMSPCSPLEYRTEKIDPYTFATGHTIRVRIDIRTSHPGRTYYLDYDSTSKHSMVDLPGIVVSEKLLPAVSTGILLLPLLVSSNGVKFWRRLAQTPRPTKAER